MVFFVRGEDDIVELLWKSGQVVESSQTQRPPVPPPILRGSGSGGGGGEESAPLPPPPPLHSHQQQPSDDQNLFIGEDEMASWLLHHPLREEDQFHSHLFYSGVVSAVPSTQPQASVSLTPPQPPAANTVYTPTATERPMGQAIAARRAESVFNFWRLRENIHNTRGRVEAAAAPWVPVVKDSTQVGSSATPSSSVATATSGVLQAFAVPSLCQRGVETVCEVAGPSSSVVSKTETELLGIETEAGDDERKRKEREEPADDTEVSRCMLVTLTACRVSQTVLWFTWRYRKLVKKLVVQPLGRGHGLRKCITSPKGFFHIILSSVSSQQCDVMALLFHLTFFFFFL